ncbi:hypothetical protein BCON_0151g00080 [Botryotinia convoluta]|uniref:Carrier domain-containing protein n=1 Tax=Botryotinia convoluta TaxID=54673 RepID=A0A4Z1HT52_9HELO|nr:hypothetical protein BCON_0151g00080 [Botryotinia convoluta]
MHTSGTTGTPKPTVIPQGVITGLDVSQKATSLYGIATTSDYWRGLRCFLAFPLFPVLPPSVPLTAELANEVHIHGKVQVANLPPAVLVEISKVPEYLKNLLPVKYIMTGGGPLPNGPGDIINSHARLFAGFGSTEIGHIQVTLPPEENWDYFDFSTSFGVEMRHHSGELYELVISSLLIEPINPEWSKGFLLDELWPTIKTANISCPAHARIMSKEFVAFTKPDKPFPRARKGTIIRTISNFQGFENFSPSENFFKHGLDSLGVISLTRAVNSVFESQNPPQDLIRESMIYAYLSPEKLARALSNSGKDENECYSEMQEEHERFVSDLPIIAKPSTPVTGPKLNSSSSKGLSTNFSRVRFLSMATGATEAWLGIKLDQYKELLNEVTHIIHNAWHVDFNMSFSQMGATHIRRVRQLIDFSAHSRFGASIHFISSISTVGNWDVANIPASIYRVGQIDGPKSSNGKWNKQEWFPLILKSSTYLKVLLSSLGPLEAVDWIPVDIIGKVVYELVTSSNHDTLELDSTIESFSGSPGVYHLVNPKRTTYSDAILPRLQSILDLPTIPFQE